MKVYALIGKSGTGKSYQAMDICRRYHIEAIIDDGLFIYENMVVAGVSAKRDVTKIGAIRTALFQNEDLRYQVVQAIKAKNPKSILVLGTSVRMTEKIIDRLYLLDELDPEPVEHLFIEDITTAEERETARQQRDKQGKHAIPAPALQLKRNFAGYFLDPLRILRGKDVGAAAERTVVRPTYSYMGEYFVAERVLEDIVECVTDGIPAVTGVIRVVQNSVPEAFKLRISLRLYGGVPIWETAEALQRQVAEAVEQMTAFNVSEVDIEIRAIEQSPMPAQ